MVRLRPVDRSPPDAGEQLRQSVRRQQGKAGLLSADRTGAPPEADAVHRVVTTVIGGVAREPPR